MKGNTASLTAMWRSSRASTAASAATLSPIIARVAILASGTPMALDTNGTVREARGLTSMTYTTSWRIANCTLISPTTPSARASALVWARS